ncbi:MAG: hypothetical protein KDB21_08945 [Acidimicrobiales bacterium]|nr:hypothetical protein [Acidimicrobiales bacterium]
MVPSGRRERRHVIRAIVVMVLLILGLVVFRWWDTASWHDTRVDAVTVLDERTLEVGWHCHRDARVAIEETTGCARHSVRDRRRDG